jgi:hypothetical protein
MIFYIHVVMGSAATSSAVTLVLVGLIGSAAFVALVIFDLETQSSGLSAGVHAVGTIVPLPAVRYGQSARSVRPSLSDFLGSPPVELLKGTGCPRMRTCFQISQHGFIFLDNSAGAAHE